MQQFLNNFTDTFEKSDCKKNAFKVFIALKSLKTYISLQSAMPAPYICPSKLIFSSSSSFFCNFIKIDCFKILEWCHPSIVLRKNLLKYFCYVANSLCKFTFIKSWEKFIVSSVVQNSRKLWNLDFFRNIFVNN